MDKMQAQRTQPNWWKYMLDIQEVHDPGTYYAYCSGTMNLTSAALARGTRTWLPTLFAISLAEPLGMSRYYYNLTQTGEGYLGGAIQLEP